MNGSRITPEEPRLAIAQLSHLSDSLPGLEVLAAHSLPVPLQVQELKLVNRFAFDNALHAREAIYIPTSSASSRCWAPPPPAAGRRSRTRSRTADQPESYGLPSGVIPTWEWCVHDAAPAKQASSSTPQLPVSTRRAADQAAPLDKGSASPPFAEIELMLIKARKPKESGCVVQLQALPAEPRVPLQRA